MKSKRIFTCSIAVLISLATVFTITTPIVRANGDTIPTEYGQQLDLNGIYVYNVSAFSTEGAWYDYTYNPEGNFLSNPGGQIHINFTGFYNRDPNDSGDYCDFPNINMPWMDIVIYNKTVSGLNENFKLENRSNSEVAFNLAFNYMNFNAGFLVPKNWTWLNHTAYNNAAAGNANITVEESYNFISFDFDQTGAQRTKLVYDKSTGLLVSANTSIAWSGYNLVIQSLNFTLDYNRTYNYNIVNFGDPSGWWNFDDFSSEGFNTNPTGLISINFTGDHAKHPNDGFNAFNDPIPWINISIFTNNSGVLTINSSFINRSNGESASNLMIGYNGFQSGFRIPIDNLSYIKDFARKEKDGFAQGNVTIMESDLTVKIIYNQYPSGQKTHLIYEKLTGLLLWINSSLGTYLLEMKIEGYTPWFDDSAQEAGPTPPPPDIQFLPYLIVIIASVAIVIPIEVGSRTSSKTKKYALLAMIAASSFSGLLFFNNNMNLLLGSSTLNQRVDNITLIVDYGNGTVYESPSFSLLGGKTTVYDALDAWCSVELQNFAGLGNQVVAINGYEPSGGWTYSIDGKYAGEITTTGLNNGDTVRFTAH